MGEKTDFANYDRVTSPRSRPLPWDRYDAYLFDLDGTLLHCADAVHYFAFCDALESLSGRKMNLDGVTAHGNTDTGILRDALLLAGIPEDEWRPRLADACTSMCAQVQDQQEALNVSALLGVVPVLEHLKCRGALLGVATGNLEIIGRLKLTRCGLLDYFEFGAYSDGFETRVAVFAHALSIAHSIAGPQVTVCAVGDTPADIRAAHDNNMSVIAVASGVHPYDALAAESPDFCVTSLQQLLAFPPNAATHSDPESLQIPARGA